jgi:hypothetical protein
VEDGNKIIKLTMKYDIFTTSISFIPEANNLASRLVLDYSPDGVHKFHTDIRVIRFAEPVPGIFFPAEIIGNELSDGVDKAGEANRKFINIMINQPIRDEDLKPMLPDNTLVNDTIRGQYYFVNANGKPITEKKSTNEKKPTQNQVAPEFAASPYTGQTQEEAANHFWLYLGLIATLGIGGFVYWRLRARMA